MYSGVNEDEIQRVKSSLYTSIDCSEIHLFFPQGNTSHRQQRPIFFLFELSPSNLSYIDDLITLLADTQFYRNLKQKPPHPTGRERYLLQTLYLSKKIWYDTCMRTSLKVALWI